MSWRINVDASLWNLYCFTGTWGYTFKPPARKMTKTSHDVNEKGYLLCAIYLFLVATAFFMDFEDFLNYYSGNDLSFFSLLIKLFGHLNRSILIFFLSLSYNFHEYQKCGGILCYFVWGKRDIRIFIGWRI